MASSTTGAEVAQGLCVLGLEVHVSSIFRACGYSSGGPATSNSDCKGY